MTQVIGTEVTASGAGIPGIAVVARLVAPFGFLKDDPDGADVIQRVDTTTDSDGAWSLTLTPTTAYLYNAAYYDITIAGQVYPVAVPDLNDPILMRDCLINPPNPGETFIPVVGTKGDPGPANVLAVGTVAEGVDAAVTITGTSPHQTISFVLPQGEQGATGDQGPVGPPITLSVGSVSTVPSDQLASADIHPDATDPSGESYLADFGFPAGVPGESAYQVWLDAGNSGSEATFLVSLKGTTGDPGPANNLSVGTVVSGSSAGVTLTGSSPNQVINFTLPQGAQGDPGQDGPPNTLTVNSVTTGAPGSDATVTVSGVAPNQFLDFVIPQGATGAEGPAGDTSSFMPKIIGPIPNRLVRVDSNGNVVQTTLDLDTVSSQLDSIAGKANTSSISAVGLSGSYPDLLNKPSIPVQYSDLTGIVPTSALPSLAINDYFVVANQAARLALTAQRGDMASQTDNGLTYVLGSDDPTQNANWHVITAPATVNSVNGQTGVVVLTVSDISGAATTTQLNSYQLLTGRNAANGYAGLDGSTKLATAQIPDLSGTYLTTAYTPPVTSVNSKTGAVALTSADVGAIPLITSPTANRLLLAAADGTATQSTVAISSVVLTNDSRLTDARTPLAHTHNATDINAGVLDAARIPDLSTVYSTTGALSTGLAGKVDELRTDTTDPGDPLLEYHRQYATDSANTDLIQIYNAGQDGTHVEQLVSWMNEWGGWRFQIPESEKFDAAIRIIGPAGTKTQPYFQVQNNARTQDYVDIQADGSLRTGVTKDGSGNWTVVGGVTLTVDGHITGSQLAVTGTATASNLPVMTAISGGWQMEFGGKSLFLTDTDPDTLAADGDYWLP